jgi:chromosome segregation ATPase
VVGTEALAAMRLRLDAQASALRTAGQEIERLRVELADTREDRNSIDCDKRRGWQTAHMLSKQRDEARLELADTRATAEVLRDERERLWDALRQKTDEADNLRQSTADLMGQRDKARRMYCEVMSVSEPRSQRAIALDMQWYGLYPPEVSP